MQLAALLYLTGGIANPFALLLIAPVTLAGASLPVRYAGGLGGLAIAATIVLALAALPLPWVAGEHAGAAAGLPPRPRRRADPRHRLHRRLRLPGGVRGGAHGAGAATSPRRVLAREQRLSALGALAAAAAHELGTPLATIAVVAKEMAREAPDGPLREDAELLIAQAQRCRDILRRLAETPDAGDEVHERMSLLQFVREVVEPYAGAERGAGRGGGHRRRPACGPGRLAPARGAPRHDLARRERLRLRPQGDPGHRPLRRDHRGVEVRDDGPGFSPQVLAKLGEPYVTSRPGAEGSRTGHIGMGLGFFIAKTLLERTGAGVEFRNGRRGGAIVAARWPRSADRGEPPIGLR